MTIDPNDFETTEPMGAAAVVALVRAAAAAAPDARAAKLAAQERAAQADIAAALAAFPDGSPDALAAVAGLGALGVAAARIAASVKWYRSAHEATAETRRDGGEDASDPRPVVQLGAELKANVDAAVGALARDPDLYQRDGALVRMTRPPGDDAPVIRPHTLATLRVRLAAHTRFQQWKDGKEAGWSDALPTDHVAKGVLEQAEWPSIRDLAGVVESPFMRPDGTVCTEPGYDPATRFLYVPKVAFPPVPEAPTQQEACDALRFAWVELCHDFPYRGMGYPAPDAASSDPDGVLRFLEARKSPDAWGIIAAIMTILARPAIGENSIPAIIFDASTPGSGKGLQVDVATTVALGYVPGKLTWPNRGKDTNAEVEKMIQGEARAGAACTILDEITGAFGGAMINNALTGDGWVKCRLMGLGETAKLRWMAVILGAGNNITFADNTHRRILLPRLEPPEENPEEHTGWRHTEPPLKEWARENRPALVAAILTVLRAYVVAGKPDPGQPLMGSYAAWSALVPRAIMWAGGGDVLGCRPTVDPEARNEERDAMAAIMASMAMVAPAEGITVGRYLDALYSADRLRGEHDRAPDGHDDAREAIEGLTGSKPGYRPEAKRLGDRLKVWRKRPIGTRQFDHVGFDRTKVARWGVVQVRK